MRMILAVAVALVSSCIATAGEWRTVCSVVNGKKVCQQVYVEDVFPIGEVVTANTYQAPGVTQ